jgi:hypothetical protein
MKERPILSWLVSAVVVLAVIVAGAGLFSQDGAPFTFVSVQGREVEMYGVGIYANESAFKAPIQRGTDAVTLVIALPLLVYAFLRYRRGSLRGGLLLVGALSYLLYYGASLALGASYNELFLLYTALFSVAFFALAYAMTAIDPPALRACFSERAPARGAAIFMFVAGLGVYFIWLSEIVGPQMQGQPPGESLGPYTTMVTHALDMAIIAPTAILTGYYLLRRAPAGYLLAVPMLVLCSLIGAVVIVQTVFQALAGITFPIGVYIGMVGSWIVLGAFALWLAAAFFRSLSEDADSQPAGARVAQA